MSKRKSYEPDDRIERSLGPKLARSLWTTYEALPDDEEESLLCLALLKERASWRKFLDQSWEAVIEADRSNRELIAAHPKGAPDPAADPGGYWPRAGKNDGALRAFVLRCRGEFGIQDRTLIATVFAKTEQGYFLHDRLILSAEALSVLNPAMDEGSISGWAKRDVLPRLFFSYGIRQLPPSKDGGLWPVGWDPSLRSRPAPHERILKVNLSKKRAQLEAEFAAFLDHEEAHDAPFDRSRFREKVWTHLKVWRLRRQRKGFGEIASSMKMNVSAAKMSFYRAFEMIEKRRYNRDDFRRSYWEIRKEELKRTCAVCPDRKNCTILCPDVLPFINQDIQGSRELSIGGIAEVLPRDGRKRPCPTMDKQESRKRTRKNHSDPP